MRFQKIIYFENVLKLQISKRNNIHSAECTHLFLTVIA